MSSEKNEVLNELKQNECEISFNVEDIITTNENEVLSDAKAKKQDENENENEVLNEVKEQNKDEDEIKPQSRNVKNEVLIRAEHSCAGSKAKQIIENKVLISEQCERKRLLSRIEYYNKLIEKLGDESKLTPNQRKKYNEYTLKAQEMNINITPKPKLSTEEKKERNKQRQKQRYQKLRQSPEWVKQFNEYQRNRYHQKKLEREEQRKAETTETLKTLGNNKKAKINKINV